MKVLITGGCGFIGSHAVDYLIEGGHEVCAVDNLSRGKDHWQGKAQRPMIEVLDITNYEALCSSMAKFKPETVIHLAANHYIPYCEKHPYEAYALNVVGTMNVLHVARTFEVKRVFFASTGDIYRPQSTPHREDDEIAPFTVYGKTKLIGEALCKDAVGWDWPRHILIGRLFNAVGPRETNPHLVPEVVAQIASGQSVLRLGNLFPTRDFIDVRSLARAIVDVTAAAKEGLEITNIGSGVSITVESMVEMIVRASGREVEVLSVPEKCRPSERDHLCPDTNRLRSLIGYAPSPVSEQTIKEIFASLEQ